MMSGATPDLPGDSSFGLLLKEAASIFGKELKDTSPSSGFYPSFALAYFDFFSILALI